MEKDINQFLTFYHEFRIPEDTFFLKKGSEKETLFLSSPSRMGNHALISMLDSHPELPKIPGEDAFLTWAFVKANDDLSQFMNDIRDINYVEEMASDSCSRKKWLEHKKIFDTGDIPEIYNGVQYNYNKNANGSLYRMPERDSFVDFQGVALDIDYDAYRKALSENRGKIEHAFNFAEIFDIYLKAHHCLLNKRQENYCVDFAYACSGMRVQSLWALNKNKNAKLITSIRRFESYAVSMIKSFYKTSEIRPEYLKEAWEQWHHKVVDYLYLKLNFPDQVLLVDFDDFFKDSRFVAHNICDFLGIGYDACMQEATINGVKVKGNSSESRKDKEGGLFYKSVSKELDAKHVPEDYHTIWGMFSEMKYDGLMEKSYSS